jgi:hypothetical protein
VGIVIPSLLFYITWDTLYAHYPQTLGVLGLYLGAAGGMFLMIFWRKLRASHYEQFIDIFPLAEQLSRAKKARVKLLIGLLLLIEGFITHILYLTL